MKMKGMALGVALAMTVGLATPPPASATGIPVVDVAAIAQAIQQYGQMVQQLEQLKSQLQQAKQQYESMTGGRGMESLLRDDKSYASIPTNWQEALAQTQGGSEISGLAKSIKDNASRVDTATLDRLLPEYASSQSTAFANSAASSQASAGQVYDNASSRFSRLESLMTAIGSAQDPKAIADLQARIGVESAMLQNEQIKMQAMAQAANAQQAIERQQVRELTMDQPSSNNTLRSVVR